MLTNGGSFSRSNISSRTHISKNLVGYFLYAHAANDIVDTIIVYYLLRRKVSKVHLLITFDRFREILRYSECSKFDLNRTFSREVSNWNLRSQRNYSDGLVRIQTAPNGPLNRIKEIQWFSKEWKCFSNLPDTWVFLEEIVEANQVCWFNNSISKYLERLTGNSIRIREASALSSGV